MRGLLLLGLLLPCSVWAQGESGDVHVRVVLNADGSRTTYETDIANRKSIATTTDDRGKLRDKIRYDLDENGRFIRGQVLGPKDQLRFYSQYKYDANNRLSEEVHLTKDQSVISRLVFRYDPAGHQTGYVVYDGNGNLLADTTQPNPAPAKRK